MVRRVCRAHLRRHADVEDAVQETFIQFLEADRRRIQNVEAWLVRVASRVCARSHRWRYGHPEVELAEGMRTAKDDGALEDVLDAVWFRKMASHLSQLDGEALTLLYLHDLPRSTIAERLGISMDHLRVVAFRARRRAHRIIVAYDDTVGP